VSDDGQLAFLGGWMIGVGARAVNEIRTGRSLAKPERRQRGTRFLRGYAELHRGRMCEWCAEEQRARKPRLRHQEDPFEELHHILGGTAKVDADWNVVAICRWHHLHPSFGFHGSRPEWDHARAFALKLRRGSSCRRRRGRSCRAAATRARRRNRPRSATALRPSMLSTRSTRRETTHERDSDRDGRPGTRASDARDPRRPVRVRRRLVQALRNAGDVREGARAMPRKVKRRTKPLGAIEIDVSILGRQRLKELFAAAGRRLAEPLPTTRRALFDLHAHVCNGARDHAWRRTRSTRRPRTRC
jgi:hypothetical protein